MLLRVWRDLNHNLPDSFKKVLINNYSLTNSKRSSLVQRKIENSNSFWETQVFERLELEPSLLFGRLGGTEATCLGIYLDFKYKYKHPIRYLISKIMYNKRLDQLCNNAGVYPKTREIFDFFCEEHLNSLNLLDIFSVWGKPTAWVESNYAHKKKILFVSGDASFPWLEARDGVSEVGWGMAFAGKKVLVVSPFIDSIKIQVPKFNLIFKGLSIPEIHFQYLRAPMSQGGIDDGKSYKFHLLNLKSQIKTFDFDIALVSAGAYSLPLAAYAKELGKIGIHAGGAMQLFFGITGKRYDNYPIVQRYFNSEWKRPFEHERPANWRSIEDGCYW
jgi:hypothetical protein